MKRLLLATVMFIALVALSFGQSVSVFFLDVGQGDCELIKDSTHAVLIDTATEEMASRIISFLKSNRVSAISLLILTHPHADHIGSAADVISLFRLITSTCPK